MARHPSSLPGQRLWSPLWLFKVSYPTSTLGGNPVELMVNTHPEPGCFSPPPPPRACSKHHHLWADFLSNLLIGSLGFSLQLPYETSNPVKNRSFYSSTPVTTQITYKLKKKKKWGAYQVTWGNLVPHPQPWPLISSSITLPLTHSSPNTLVLPFLKFSRYLLRQDLRTSNSLCTDHSSPQIYTWPNTSFFFQSPSQWSLLPSPSCQKRQHPLSPYQSAPNCFSFSFLLRAYCHLREVWKLWSVGQI